MQILCLIFTLKRIWNFPGTYANRESGMEQASSDVVESGGLEPSTFRV